MEIISSMTSVYQAKNKAKEIHDNRCYAAQHHEKEGWNKNPKHNAEALSVDSNHTSPIPRTKTKGSNDPIIPDLEK